MDIRKVLPFTKPPSIAVIGDICLDLYYFTSLEGAEISVETGLQSHSVLQTKQDAGGAGNVAVNCHNLGASVDLYGIVGSDCWGTMAKDLIAQRGIDTEGILVQGQNWQTHVYNKIYQGKAELPRYDMGNQNQPLDEKADALLDLLESRLGKYQCVIINEQVPSGLHSPYFQKKLAALIEKNQRRVLWFADCRTLNDRYAFTIRKLNIREAEKILANGADANAGSAQCSSCADWLYKRWGTPVVLTMGEEGALVCDESGCKEINSIHIIHELDIVGAGDAFLAGLVTANGAGLNLHESALFGTYAAGVSLCKLFETGHPAIEEIIAIAETGDFNYNPRIASDSRQAQYVSGTDIEIVSPDFKTAAFKKPMLKAAIFDHDGTISVLRQGWEEVMYAVMVRAIAGSSSLSPAEIARVQGAVSSLIEKTTGIQTLAQMYSLREMVLSFGHAKQTEILSPEEYKQMYINALYANMEKRLRMVETGKLKTEDVTIKGAVAFLEKLSANGVKLYLASGTDQDDVIREAQLLGYAGLFTGGIKGSVGDINNDPKKLVIQSIIAEIRQAVPTGDQPLLDSRAEIAVFGDGPVEMREARKAGLLAVGVTSDERRRWGLNGDKRKRLILGGADILIPDFSYSNELARLCGWEWKE